MVTSQFENERVRPLIAFIISSILILLGPLSLADDSVTEGSITYPQGLVALSSRSEFSPYFFVVNKKQRFLRVYENKNGWPEKILETPSDMGKTDGDKTRENDHRTPVGIYFLLDKLTQPAIPFNLYGNLAFTTDYPNIFDRRDDKTGSGIWLHAVPDNVPLTRGSRGCVVVRNDVIRDLGKFVQLHQTPLVIVEEIKELSRDEYQRQREQFLGFVETWRKAWQNEDVDTYMKFYDPTFRNSQMNYTQWYKHKKRLKGLYRDITVELSEPMILHNRDQVVIRLLQHYKSNMHDDFGEKTIHAHYSAENGFHIIREDWKPLKLPQDWPKMAEAKSATSARADATAPAVDTSHASTNTTPQN